MGEQKKTSNIPDSLRDKNKPPQKEDQHAFMSIAFGLISIALSCAGYGAIFGIIAAVFGVLGMKSKENKKLAIAGLILGILSIVLMIGVLAMEMVDAVE